MESSIRNSVQKGPNDPDIRNNLRTKKELVRGTGPNELQNKTSPRTDSNNDKEVDLNSTPTTRQINKVDTYQRKRGRPKALSLSSTTLPVEPKKTKHKKSVIRAKSKQKDRVKSDDEWGDYVTRCLCELEHNDDNMIECDKCKCVY